MAANHVPGEILAQVFAIEGTSGRDLKNFSLVNSKWRTEAQYELFRTSVFAIRHLDSLSQFTSFSTLAENKEYTYLGSVIEQLRIGLKSTRPVDPRFHDFLRNLTRIHTVYFGDGISNLLSDQVLSPELRHSLIDLLHSTTLTQVVINANEFPLGVLRSCQHIQSLTVTFPSHHISEEDPLDDRGSCSRQIEELTFSGDGYALHSFVAWLREFDAVSVDKIQHATFDIPTIQPFFERDMFLGYVSLSDLTFKTALIGPESRNDLSHLINLTTLNIETVMNDVAAQLYVTRRLNVVSCLSWGARSFIITLPAPSRLQTFRISLLGNYATNREFMAVPEGDAAYHLGILRNTLLETCPCLLTMSFYLSCPFLSQEDLDMIFSQLIHTNVSVYGPVG